MGALNLLLLSYLSFSFSDIPVNFEGDFFTCLPKQTLWLELKRSMIDSEDNWLWANELSQVSGEGLTENAIIDVTYNAGFLSPTYTYRLEDVIEGVQFRYTAEESNHPFRGGALIVLKDTLNGSRFTWTGQYLTRPSDFIQRAFFNRFSKNFFRQIDINIKNQELIDGCVL